MDSTPPNVCFYSNKCKWSEAFIGELKNTPWKREFRYICVDPGPQRPSLPKWLKQTPTIVIKGEDTPRIDGDVMNWIYEKKMSQGGGGGVSDPAMETGVEAWSSEFGSGLGHDTSYSLIGSDTTATGTGGETMRGNFAFLNGSASPTMNPEQFGNGPNGGPSNTKTKKEQMFDSQIEEYMRARDAGIPKGPARQ